MGISDKKSQLVVVNDGIHAIYNTNFKPSMASPNLEVNLLESQLSPHVASFLPDGKISSLEEYWLWKSIAKNYVANADRCIAQDRYLPEDIDAITNLPIHVPFQSAQSAAYWCDLHPGKCSKVRVEQSEYVQAELRAAKFLGQDDLTVYHDVAKPIDRRNDPKFLAFANALTHLPKTLLSHVNTSVVDWVASNPSDPVILIWLDKHDEVLEQRTMLMDWIRVRKFDPLYAVEGTAMGEMQESQLSVPGYAAKLQKHYMNIASQVFDYTVRAFTDWKCQSQFSPCILDAPDMIKKQPEGLQGWSAIATHSEPLATACGQPRFQDRVSALDHLVAIYDGLKKEYIGFLMKDANQCIYHGAMQLYGWENETAFDAQINQSQALMDAMIMIYRSQVGIDNTLQLMTDHSKTVGVMRMGKAHYPSLRQHAEKLKNVNVIFLRLHTQNADTGPLPKLPE